MAKTKKSISIIIIIMGGIFIFMGGFLIVFPLLIYTGVINGRELFGLGILTIYYYLPLIIILGIVSIIYGVRFLLQKGE